MKIALDAHTLGSRIGGNETYIKNLIEGFQGIDGEHEYLLYLVKRNEDNRFLKSLPQNFSPRFLWPKNPLIRIPFATPYRLLKDQVDLMHLQYAAPPVCPVPYVLTLHDMSWERYPEYFEPVERFRLKRTTPVSVRNAAHVITCSESTKKDLMNLYSVAEEKITVTYYGKNDAFKKIDNPVLLENVKAKYGIRGKYILVVGNIQPRKNIGRLVEAFTRLKKNGKIPHKLVVVGKKAWLYADIFECVRAAGAGSEILFTDYVPDEELPLLYNGADLFIYPSIFEGFGFPVLEAMACGTPVITSNTSSMPEVAGDAAVLINPLSVPEIEKAIFETLSGEILRRRLVEAGLKRAELFTWEKTCRQTLAVYENILK